MGILSNEDEGMKLIKLIIVKSFRLIGIDWFFIKDILNVIRGFRVVNREMRTPLESFHSMINLFCRTRGRSNQIIHKIVSLFSSKVKLDSIDGIVPIKSKLDLKKVVKQLDEKGYVVFENVLTEEVCDYLYKFGTTTESSARPLYSGRGQVAKNTIIDFNNLIAIHYDFNEETLINDPVIQSLMADKSLIAIAQEYLNCTPISNVTGMWWQTDFEKTPNDEAATMWHFDMDHVRWIKYFFYITDVNTNSGPHCFVEGTHKPGKIPKKLLKRGYARITDEEIAEAYPENMVKEFIGKRGTLIIEDTIGLHKGKHVVDGSRLLFQLTFSDHLFGGNYPERKFRKFTDSKVKEFIFKNPKIFRKYLETSVNQ